MALPLTGLPNFQLWLVAPLPAATVTGEVAFEDPATPIPSGTAIQLLDDTGAPVMDMPDEFPLAVSIDSDVVDLGAFAISLAAAGDPDELVRTGVDPFWPLVGAGVVAALGVLLLMKRRRTKDDSASDDDVTD